MAGSYPQQFSAGVFYVPPPQTLGNAFSAAWHGWHGIRSKYALLLFNARMAALDPAAQYKLLESLYERRAQMLEQAASLERAAMQAQSNAQAGSDRRYAAWVSANASLQSAYLDYRRGREAAEIGLQGDILKAGHMDDTARAHLEEYRRSADAAATAANQGRFDDAAKIMEDALNVAEARIGSMDNDPMQADTLRRAIRGTQLPINDPVFEQAMSASVEASIEAAPEYNTTKPGGAGRPATLPFADPAAAAPPNGSGQAPPPAAGRQPASTGGGTTAPAPSSAAPAPTPAPPYGSTASSTSVRTSGASPALTAQMLAAAAELGADIQDVRAGIPNARAELGGFYDPIPGTPPRGGRAKRSAIIAQDLAGPGRSMQAAAAPPPRPTFAPLPTSAAPATVPAAGEPPRGGGVVSTAAGSQPSPAPKAPAPKAPAPAPAARAPVAAPESLLYPPPPPITRDEYVAGIMGRDLFGAGSGSPPVAAPTAPRPADDLAGPAPTAPAWPRWGQEFNRAWYSFDGPFTEFSPLWDDFLKQRATDPALTWEKYQGSR